MTAGGTGAFEPATATVDGRAVRYARAGSGPPLVCVHGYPETGLLYERLADCLGDAFTVVAVDWPGLGGSEPWPGMTAPRDRASQLLGILDALVDEDAYLFGTDMGGPPALLAAARQPDRIRGVVASNALLFGDGETSLDIALFRSLPIANRLALTYAPRIVFRRTLRTFLPAGISLAEHLRRDFWAHFRRRPLRDRLVAMCADYESALGGLAARYADVSAPVLACWGADDHHFPPSQGRRLVEAVGDGTCVRIDGGHHWMCWHAAERVAAAIRQWAEH